MDKKWLRESPGTRLVFWVYAGLAGVGGLLLLARGPMWFGADLPGVPFGKAALIRLAGAVIMAAGCFGAAMGEVADEEARRRGMLWFVAGHGILWVIVLLEQHAIWDKPLADKVLILLFIPPLAFLFFRGDYDRPATLQTLFGGAARGPRVGASRYEREIREAAGREERNRLARDLHDSIKQQLFAIQTAAATAQTRFEPDPDGARDAIGLIRSSAREAMTEMEVMLDQLRAAPLENVGLVEALKLQGEAVGFRTGAKVAFTLGELPPNASLPPGARQALFRVAQEALSNVARHARAANLNITLATAESSLKLTVEDDGAGFDPDHPPTGMGIRNMRERAAEFGGIFELASSLGGSTRISVALPFHTPGTQAEQLKKMRNEGLALLCMMVITTVGHTGAVIVIMVLFGFRFLRSLMGWLDLRAGREAIR